MQKDSSQKSLKLLPRGGLAASMNSTQSITSKQDGQRNNFSKGVGLSYHQQKIMMQRDDSQDYLNEKLGLEQNQREVTKAVKLIEQSIIYQEKPKVPNSIRSSSVLRHLRYSPSMTSCQLPSQLNKGESNAVLPMNADMSSKKFMVIEQSSNDAKIYSVPPSKDSMSGQPTAFIRMPGGIEVEGSDIGLGE